MKKLESGPDFGSTEPFPGCLGKPAREGRGPGATPYIRLRSHHRTPDRLRQALTNQEFSLYPPDDDTAAMYRRAQQFLTQQGYDHYAGFPTTPCRGTMPPQPHLLA